MNSPVPDEREDEDRKASCLGTKGSQRVSDGEGEEQHIGNQQNFFSHYWLNKVHESHQDHVCGPVGVYVWIEFVIEVIDPFFEE